MPGSVDLVKAELHEIDLNKPQERAKSKFAVQFNPETLKVSLSNQIQTPEGGSGDQKGGSAQQFVGAGTTKLTVQLWFDVNAPQKGTQIKDVRKMTQNVAKLITPAQDPKDKKKFLPPGVRFIWGSFQFEGIMESFEENLEFFSDEGIPLRASVTINLTQQRIDQYKFNETKSKEKKLPGTRPLTAAPSGSNVQSLASGAGKGDDWQSVAAANGIENPRNLQAGMLLDMNAKIGVSGGIGGNVPLINETGAALNFSAQAKFGTE